MDQPIEITDDLRIAWTKELATPAEVLAEFPVTERTAHNTALARRAIQNILRGDDRRLLVVIGPCSIHDPAAALEYAGRLADARARYGDALEIVMRVYFEKPRTTVGWKGLINDPDLDNSFDINKGLRLARKLLCDINALGVPAGTEFLDLVTGQYYADLVSWGAIGARTTESQVHRELASGLSCPVGFKNGTDGDIGIAIDAVRAARLPHVFLTPNKHGHTAIMSSNGNDDAHIILRGGRTPNCDADSVARIAAQLASAGLTPRLIVDLSHANSGKDPQRQLQTGADIAARIAAGEPHIAGVMIESHLVAGRQDVRHDQPLTYGQSITDACLGWEDSERLLERLADGVR